MEKSKKTVSKCMALILVISVLALCFSGCSNEKTGFTYKFVVLEKADEIKTEDLGELRTDGDFHEVNPNNMLKYLGYYSGPDFVTIVFDKSSPIGLRNVELFISEKCWLQSFHEGVLYRKENGKKYVEFKFRTIIHSNNKQMDTAKYSREFSFPYKASEPMSFYQVCILPFRGISDVEYDACVCKAVQKAVINQSGYGFNWTDYKYDLELQYYFADSDKWETATKKDMKTDHAPRL
jgi:hypothetical protein